MKPTAPRAMPPFDPWLAYTTTVDVASATRAGAAALAERRARRLAALLASAAQRSAFYRRRLKGADPSRLQDLPVVHKAELMRRFEDWVADPALHLAALRRFVADRARIADPFLDRYVVWESSGSSGEPGIFVQDAAAMAVYDTLEALRKPVLQPLARLMDPWYLGERIAFVGATGGHFASTVSIERLRRLQPALAGRLRGISFLQPIDALVAALDAFAPTIVATYPSAAALLAEERMAGRLRAAPREIWTGGEDLSAAMRHFVQQAFGCRVASSYGASEFLSMASECDRGRLHLNSDWVILEPVDAQGRAVPPGEAGATTLLTNLANHLQPLIRYDLGDRVTLHAEPCACGSPLPAIEVGGRCDDTLKLGRARTRPVAVLPLALSTVLEEEAGLFDFQLEQRGPCDLLLRTGLDGEAGQAALGRARRVLTDFLAGQGAAGVRIRCRGGEAGLRGRSGKVPRVIAKPV